MFPQHCSMYQSFIVNHKLWSLNIARSPLLLQDGLLSLARLPKGHYFEHLCYVSQQTCSAIVDIQQLLDVSVQHSVPI